MRLEAGTAWLASVCGPNPARLHDRPGLLHATRLPCAATLVLVLVLVVAREPHAQGGKRNPACMLRSLPPASKMIGVHTASLTTDRGRIDPNPGLSNIEAARE